MGIERTKKQKAYNLVVSNDIDVANKIEANDIDALGTLSTKMTLAISYVFASDGNANRAIYSTDTINWTTVTLPQTQNYRGYSNIIVDDKGNVIGRSRQGRTIAYSSDLINWTASTLPSGFDDYWNPYILYADNKYLAVDGSYQSLSAYSTDLITWTTVDISPLTFTYIPVFGNNKFAALFNNTSYQAAIYVSTDAIEWTVRSITNFSPNRLIFADNNFLVYGYHTTLGTSSYYASTDTITWTIKTFNLPSENPIIQGGGKYITSGSDYTGIYYYSTDLVSWTTSSLPFSPREVAFSYGQGQFAAFGYEQSSAYISTDAITWTARSLGISYWRFSYNSAASPELTPPLLYSVGEKLQELIQGGGGGADIFASPTFTGTVTLPSTTSIGNVTSTELGYLDGVTSAIQTQINEKSPSASPTFTGTITASNITATGLVLSYVNTNAQTGTAYTLVLSDAGKVIERNNASANTLTIPPNSSVAFPIGTKIDIVQTGAGETSIAPGSGVTLNSDTNKRKINAQWAAATLIKRGTNTWVLIGALKA